RPSQNQQDPTYYETTVWNKGELMAEDCDMRIDLDGQEFELFWQPQHQSRLDIRPDRKQKSDVFRIVPLERNVELPIAENWDQSKKLGLGKYTGTVSIGAKNCKPAK